MFDFPDAPAVGDIYVSGSATYNWDGMTWNLGTTATMDDYVLKAGDTMTGSLAVTGAASNVTVDGQLTVNGGAKTCIRLQNCDIRQVGEGNMEFWTDNGGYSTTWAMKLEVENPPMTRMRRLNFGQVTAGSINDLSNHITLYDGGTTSPFGFNIRSGTLGYVVGNAANKHAFSVGGAEIVTIDQNCISFGTKSAVGDQDKTHICLYDSGSSRYGINVSGGQLGYYITASSTRHSFWQSGAERFYVDSSGSHGLMMTATEGFVDRTPARIAALKTDSTFRSVVKASQGDSEDEPSDGYDVGDLLMLALAEIKALKAEVAALKGGAPTQPKPATPTRTPPTRRR